jgi:uncharacterized membrane protein
MKDPLRVQEIKYKDSSKRFFSLDLGLVLLFAFLAYLFVLVPPFNQTPLRIIFALPLLLFLPGYALIAVMFPRKNELSGIERFTLSIGLSIAIFVFDGFAISVTAWRFRPEPIILSLSLITLILLLFTFLIRLRIPKEERFYFDFSLFSKFFEAMRSDEKPSDIERALVIALVGSIIIASGMLIYAKVTFEEERFTAFYILGEGGKAENYTTELHLLEPSSIIVGIENYEHAPANYTLQANLGGYPIHLQQITLAHGEKWKDNVFFTPKHVARHMKLEFLLHKDGSTNPYRSVHLWVDSVIGYDNLATIRKYALSDLPIIGNQDMELESNWVFTENAGYFRGHFTKFYRMEENATVRGYVTDNATRLPIANARVSVNNHYGYEKSNITNKTGYYAIKTIEDHLWMESRADNYEINGTEFNITDGQTLIVNITNDPIIVFNMTLEKLSIINETIETLPEEFPEWILTLKGYVIDDTTGLPIVDAGVIVSAGEGVKIEVRTNESGHFELKTIPGEAIISVNAEGYMEKRTTLIISGDRTINFQLSPVRSMPLTSMIILPIAMAEAKVDEHTEGIASALELPPWISIVKGYVTDEVTGAPIANARIKIRSGYGFEQHATTNERGYFEKKVIPGRSWVEAKADGYMSNRTKYDISGEYAVDLKLTPARSTVKGYIYDNTTGAVIPDADIRVDSDGYSSSTRSNASGYYEVGTVAGHIKLDVSKRGYFLNSTEFNTSYGEIKTIDMLVEPIPPVLPLSTISGYVSCNNTILPWAKVVISDGDEYEKSTLTDNNGYFEIETVPGHLWLDVLPSAYMDSSVEFSIKSGQKARLDIELDAFPVSTYQIDYPSETALKKGRYGGIYQDIVSEEGVATLSFKVSDSYRSNKNKGYLFKQVLLNELVIWEDDVAEDEGWQEVKIPITLDNGINRLMLRIYAKQDSRKFPLTIWWDDVRIERFEEITKERATYFYILDANGTKENYPAELYLGEPAEVIAGIENYEHETVNYVLQVKLNGELLKSENVRLEDGSKWEQKISFTPNQIGSLLKLEFLLFKDHEGEDPYKAFHRWVSSNIDYDNLEVLKNYVVSPLPVIINGDMESIGGWMYIENDVNFTGEMTDSTSISPMYSYELSYPAETPFNQECYAAIYQNFTTEVYPATVVISFNVRDSYTGDRAGYFLKQVLLNDRVIWEDDVAGHERWQHVKVPVALCPATNKLTLRVYGERASSDFPIKVWWDDVKIEPLTEVAEKFPTSFIRDAKGTEENYPTKLHLGESAEVLVVIENHEHKLINYILQIKLDGRHIKTESKWLEHGSKWEQNVSFTSDRIGDNQKLEFLLFKGSVRDKPYRYFHLWVSTDINYENLEPLLKYGIDPLPIVRDGDMRRISAWTLDYNGSFRGSRSTENASTSYSYCIEQHRASNKGDSGELSQDIYASAPGVVVISFNVRDSFTATSEDAKNITKQVLLNDKVIWWDDISGRDTGYVGWVEEEYDWLEDEWIKKVPRVKSRWTRVDIPVYLFKGDNKLRLRVYAEEATEKLPVEVYWDDVEIKRINELVKVGDGVRMRRYGW